MLSRWQAKHGVDNLPALHLAAVALQEQPEAAIVWFHGPSPELSSTIALEQHLARHRGLKLYHISMEKGTDAITDQFKKEAHYKCGPLVGPGFENRLEMFTDRLLKGGKQTHWAISCQASDAPLPVDSVQVDDQLAPLQQVHGMAGGMEGARTRREDLVPRALALPTCHFGLWRRGSGTPRTVPAARTQAIGRQDRSSNTNTHALGTRTGAAPYCFC